MNKDQEEFEHIQQLVREVLSELDVDDLFRPKRNIVGRTQVRLMVSEALNRLVVKISDIGIINKREFGLEVLMEGLLCLAADRQNKLDKEADN